MRQHPTIGLTPRQLRHALGALVVAGAAAGCAMLAGKKGPTAADADRAFADNDVAKLAQLCGNATQSDVKLRACRGFFLIQARTVEELYAKGDAAKLRDICSENVRLDRDPTTGAQIYYRVPWADIKDALPGKLAVLATETSLYPEAHAYTLACNIQQYARNQVAIAETVDPARVSSLAIPEEDVCPGRTEPVRIAVTLDDGTTLETWTKSEERKGHVDFAMFALASDHGQFGAAGLDVPADLAAIIGGVTVKAAVTGRPELATSKQLKLDLSCLKPLELWAAAGVEGTPGAGGQSFAGSFAASGAAQGGAGGPGGPGGPGAGGANVQVDVGIVDAGASGLLLVAMARSDGAAGEWWWAKPLAEGGKLEITIGGGPGGTGGPGGRGGEGQGATPDTSEASGRGGTGGVGGPGGIGGDAGTLTVRYDKAHPELAGRLVLQALGGPAGNGGLRGEGGAPGQSSRTLGLSGNNGEGGPAGRAGKPGKTTATAVAAATLFKGKGLRLK